MNFVPDPRRKLYIETTGVCNLACRFCAYSKKRDGKVTMPMATFCDVVDQAIEMGFEEFGLTPLTGEPFMDRGFIEKLRALEVRRRVTGYHFYTNFTLPSARDIRALASLTKLQYMHISLYGHDLDTFQSITRKPVIAYRRLVRNLKRCARFCRRRLERGFACHGERRKTFVSTDARQATCTRR